MKLLRAAKILVEGGAVVHHGINSATGVIVLRDGDVARALELLANAGIEASG